MIAHAVYIGVMASFACSAEPCLVSAVAIADHIARGTAHPGGAWNRGCTVAAAKPAAHRGSMIAVAIVVPIAVVVAVVVPATIVLWEDWACRSDVRHRNCCLYGCGHQ